MGSLLNHMLDKQRPRRIEIPEGWRTAADGRLETVFAGH